MSNVTSANKKSTIETHNLMKALTMICENGLYAFIKNMPKIIYSLAVETVQKRFCE